MTLKKGDTVDLDCGYNGMEDMRRCRLMEDPQESIPLFANSKSDWIARVEILGTGETFNAVLPLTPA